MKNNRIPIHVSLSREAVDLIDKEFPYGKFSVWVEEQIKAYSAQKQAIGSAPEVKGALSDMTERAVQVLVRNWGGERTFVLATRWENMIKEKGGSVSAAELISIARKRKA